MNEKLQKVLARAGLASRRTIEEWISQGRITVNGEVASLGMRVSLDDHVTVDGQVITLDVPDEFDVLIYHKRLGEICSERDPEGRPTVFDALPQDQKQRWIMVGRLDINTSGLLLFTTQGELVNRLMHPRYEFEREYQVRVRGAVSPQILNKLKSGVQLEDGPAHFEQVEYLRGEQSNIWYRVIIKEGRNREVRRLWESQGISVNRLVRVRFGAIKLPHDLAQGKYQFLSPVEKQALLKAAALAE